MKLTGSFIAQVGCLAWLFIASGTSIAQTPQSGGEQRKPPREAMEACKALSAGQGCSFSSSERSLKGTCWAPQGKPLACKPQGLPQGGEPPTKK